MKYEEEKKWNTLNCSSEQMRTLCEVTDVGEVGETFSEYIVVGAGTLGVESVDSIVGILEPDPMDWFELSSTTILKTGALCFNRISFAKIRKQNSKSTLKE